MFNSLSIKAKLLSIVISSIIIVSTAMIIQSVISLKQESNFFIEEFKQDAYKVKEREGKKDKVGVEKDWREMMREISENGGVAVSVKTKEPNKTQLTE